VHTGDEPAQQLRFEAQIPAVFFQRYVNIARVMTLLSSVLLGLGLYSNMWQYASADCVPQIVLSTLSGRWRHTCTHDMYAYTHR
jgi:FlaA1/EpsC-like NDP-sugar epimerase